MQTDGDEGYRSGRKPRFLEGSDQKIDDQVGLAAVAADGDRKRSRKIRPEEIVNNDESEDVGVRHSPKKIRTNRSEDPTTPDAKSACKRHGPSESVKKSGGSDENQDVPPMGQVGHLEEIWNEQPKKQLKAIEARPLPEDQSRDSKNLRKGSSVLALWSPYQIAKVLPASPEGRDYQPAVKGRFSHWLFRLTSEETLPKVRFCEFSNRIDGGNDRSARGSLLPTFLDYRGSLTSRWAVEDRTGRRRGGAMDGRCLVRRFCRGDRSRTKVCRCVRRRKQTNRTC